MRECRCISYIAKVYWLLVMYRDKTIQNFLKLSLFAMGMFLEFSAFTQLVSPLANGIASTNYTDGSSNDDIFIFCGNGNNGSLEAPVSAGSGPYTYQWFQYNNSNYSWSLISGQTASSIFNLATGGYRVEVTDNTGVNVLCDVAWIWNINVTLNALANASACNDVNLSVIVPNVQFTYYNPPSPTAFVSNNTDITVCFSGNHSWVSDLGFYLLGPTSCGSPIITLAPNNGSLCNQGNNFNNLCFTTNPSPNFNVCNQNTPLSGTFDSAYGNPIDWSPLYGCNAAESGWSVMVYDCEQFDTGTLTNATINFQNLQSSCGTGSAINYNSGNINSAISDNSCNSNAASNFTVPLPSLYTTPLTLSANVTGTWSTSSIATISDVTANASTAYNAVSGDVFTYSLEVSVGSGVCNFSDDVTYDNSSFVPLSISYPSSLCEGGGMITPIITGANGGQFTSSPSGLTISNNGNIQLNTSAPGSYVVTYTKTIGGCVLSASVGITVQDIPENLALSPSSICAGQVFNGNAQAAFEYGYFLNGVSQGNPNTTSTVVSPALNASDDWCVRGYEGTAITLDGLITEPYWGSPLSQANSTLTSSFGSNNHLDALYVAQFRDTLNIAIAGQLENGTNNRILLFLDTEAGGFNQLSSWTNRSNAPYYSMENLSGGIQFDIGFEPDYIVAVNTDISGISFLDLYHMATNTNQYLGSSVTNVLAYQGAGVSINIASGYELQLSLSDLNNTSGNISLFAMLVNNPGSPGITTTLSNQFLSPADNGALSYGDGPVIFAAANPDPLHFVVGDPQCFLESCLTVQPNLTLNLPVVPNQCQNASSPFVLNAAVSGVNGVWSPSIIDVSIVGTDNYIFTPDILSGCYDEGSVSVEVTAPALPSFNINSDYCQGETPALLPASDGTTSGSWSPATITTNFSATAAPITYTFTPNTGQCASSFNFDIVVHPDETPVFSLLTSLCQNATPPLLPTTDNNGIQGTWNSTITTTLLGNQTHIFTPNVGDPLHECAIPLNLIISITNGTSSTFGAIGPFCQSDNPVLPSVSNEGFTGSWTPALIDMTNFSVSGQNFSFQPDPNQCANSGTLNVVVQEAVTPTFSAVSPLCLNGTAPILPLQSLQSISGTWNPSSIITTSAGTSIYTFNPSSGSCANAASISVTVQTPVNPTFTLPSSICENSIPPSLIGSSGNGISGTWSPASVNVALVGNQNFTFIPNTGVCATNFNYDLTVNDNQTPTFNAVVPYCINATALALPAQSLESIAGSWSPAMVNTSVSGTTNLIFTPSAGLCAVQAMVPVTVSDQISPTFSAIPSLCSNDIAPALSLTSTNNISGTWSPSSIDMSLIGTNPYLFTPSPNQCAANQTLNVTVNAPNTSAFSFSTDYCLNESPAALPLISDNLINGQWTPSTIFTNNAGQFIFSFVPDLDECASDAVIAVDVNAPLNAVFSNVNWNYCQTEVGDVLPVMDDNGMNGFWSPTNIVTIATGNSNYTFTPDAGECGNATTFDLQVASPTLSVFGAIQDTYCVNDVPTNLPSVNAEGISGTWLPSAVTTLSSGNFNYVFSPDPGNCYTSYTQNVSILGLPAISFTSNFPAIDCNHPLVDIIASGGVGYQWASGGLNDVISVSDNSVQWVEVIDANGCVNQASISLPLDTATASQLIYPTDMLNCLTTSIPIQVNAGQGFTWSPNGETNNSISVNAPDLYTVDVIFNNGCTRQLSINIGIDTISPIGLISNFSVFDTLTCSQPSITLVASGGASYNWVNGGNTANENYIVPGLIQVEVTGANHCLDTAEYVLYQNITPPTLNLILSDSVLDCFVDSIVVSAISNGLVYQWTNGLGSNDSVTVGEAGNYQVTVTGANGCTITNQLEIVEQRFEPDSLFTYSPQIVMDDAALLELNGPSMNGVVYTWYLNDSLVVESDDITLQLPTFHMGDFEVCMEANYTDLCKSENCEIITVYESLQCYIPNTFTPDQDNLNEGFKPSMSNVALLEQYEFSIFNRWGELIFRTNDPNQSWDGRYLNGEYYVPDGAYYFDVQYKTYMGVGIVEKKGFLNILR
jgi:gliding motility-associated-like protein